MTISLRCAHAALRVLERHARMLVERQAEVQNAAIHAARRRGRGRHHTPVPHEYDVAARQPHDALHHGVLHHGLRTQLADVGYRVEVDFDPLEVAHRVEEYVVAHARRALRHHAARHLAVSRVVREPRKWP
jgi:hypothetical protein